MLDLLPGLRDHKRMPRARKNLVLSSFTNRIRELRLARNMSAAALAARIGVPPQTLLRWEVDARQLRARSLPAIATALGCEVQELLGCSPLLTADERALLTAWRMLAPADRQTLTRMLRAVSAQPPPAEP